MTMLTENNVSTDGFYSKKKTAKCSVPQDSTLGPILFLHYINDLTNTLDNDI